MEIEWHYPREDKNDLPDDGSSVLIAEHISAWESKYHTAYALAINRMYMIEHVGCDKLSDIPHLYAWEYIEMPPLKKGK